MCAWCGGGNNGVVLAGGWCKCMGDEVCGLNDLGLHFLLYTFRCRMCVGTDSVWTPVVLIADVGLSSEALLCLCSLGALVCFAKP